MAVVKWFAMPCWCNIMLEPPVALDFPGLVSIRQAAETVPGAAKAWGEPLMATWLKAGEAVIVGTADGDLWAITLDEATLDAVENWLVQHRVDAVNLNPTGGT